MVVACRARCLSKLAHVLVQNIASLGSTAKHVSCVSLYFHTMLILFTHAHAHLQRQISRAAWTSTYDSMLTKSFTLLVQLHSPALFTP